MHTNSIPSKWRIGNLDAGGADDGAEPGNHDRKSSPGGRAWPLLAGILLLFVPLGWRRSRGWLAGLLLTAALAAGGLSGCGGSGTLTGGTPAGSYTVMVTGTATDGSITLTETATVPATVKSLF